VSRPQTARAVTRQRAVRAVLAGGEPRHGKPAARSVDQLVSRQPEWAGECAAPDSSEVAATARSAADAELDERVGCELSMNRWNRAMPS
jgi:hypothetical protein